MPIPTFKPAKNLNNPTKGGSRSQQPPTHKGAGPQEFTGARFGKGLDSKGPGYNPKPISGQGAQTKTGPHRFGKNLDSQGRPFNPLTPKSGSDS